MKFRLLWVGVFALAALCACQQDLAEEPTATMPVHAVVDMPTPAPLPAFPQTALPVIPAPEGAGLYVVNEGTDGYINAQGKMVIAPGTYASIVPVADMPLTQSGWNAPASLRLLAASRWQSEAANSGYALVNAVGEVKTEFIYADFIGGREGIVFAHKENGNYVPLWERDGQPALPGEYSKAMMSDDVMLLLSEGQLIIANSQGSVLQRIDGVTMFATPGENMIPVQDALGNWGYANLLSGKMVIEAQFDWALGFSGGLGCVGYMNGEAGFVDSGGQNVMNETFRMAYPFQNGYAIVRKPDERDKLKLFMIDEKNKALNETGFDRLQDFILGNTFTLGERFEILGKDGHVGYWRYYLLSRDGTETPLPDNTLAVKALPADRYLLTVRMEDENRMGLMDGACNWLLRPETYVTLLTTQYPLHLFAMENGKDAQWKLLDLNGREILTGFERVISSDGRLVYGRKDGKTGYMSLQGEWVYPQDELGLTP